MNAVIRRVRPDDGALLKSVRLAALADTPSAFASTYAAEVSLPDAHWDVRAAVGAAGTASASFFAVSGELVVGIVGGYRPDEAGRSVELVSMWVSPARRRAGVAAALVETVVDWARELGATAVELWVTRGNDTAVSLYERQGFQRTGEHEPLPSDPCKDEIRMRRMLGEPAPG
jgi:ribosomal protein S18 acetylase RimI-like enzyme